MDLKILLDTPPWDWPRDAAAIFQRVLTDPRADASDRLAAAELAGNLVVMNDELAATLMPIVASAAEPPDLRARAAISLGPVLSQADVAEFAEPGDVPITEDTFHQIRELLEKLYLDPDNPKEVRRRILEAAVRSPQPWHQSAIGDAWSGGDKEWTLTAVFAMRYVRGFDAEILEASQNPDPEIHYEAVLAAGNWGLEPAWPHIAALIQNPGTPKPLLIAAIGAAAVIHPVDAPGILAGLADSDDEDIAEAAFEAIAEAQSGGEEDFDEDDFDDEDEDEDLDPWIN
jgi:hypothetical protein